MNHFPQTVEKWQMNLQVCGPIASKAGGKACAILDEHAATISTGIISSHFDASGYNQPDPSRVGLCIEPDAQLPEWLQERDAESLKLCRINCQKLFGKQAYLESDLKPNYYSALKQNENTALSFST